MRAVTRIALVFLLAAIVTPAIAQPTPEEVAKLIGKSGGSAAKLYLEDRGDIRIPPSRLPPDQQNQALEDLLKKYAEVRNRYITAARVAGGGGLASELTFGAVAIGSKNPRVAIPALLLSGISKVMFDAGNAKLLALGREEGRKLLEANRDKILQAAGVSSFTEIDRSDIGRIRSVVGTAFAQFDDFRQRATGDDVLADSAMTLTTDTLMTANLADLDAASKLSRDVKGVRADFNAFVVKMKDYTDEVDKRLDAHTEAIKAITGKVNALEESIAAVDAELQRQGRDQAFIADFVLDQMPPRDKVKSLKAGFLSERFVCAPDQPKCDGPKLKQDLIARFEHEADVKDFVGKASTVVGALNDLNTIAGNFDINFPELAEAARIGNAAFGAVTAYFSGNPLGAIAAVSSLFGKQRDPNEAVMRYLQQMDRKLTIIIENQKILLEATNRLSEQMQKEFAALNNRFSGFEFEQRRMSQQVRELLWRDWKSCFSVVTDARQRNVDGSFRFIDGETERFASFERIGALTAIITTGSFEGCLKVISDDMASLNAINYFGNFIDAGRAVNDRLVPDQGTLQNPAEGKEWQSLLQSYENDLFKPAAAFAAAFREKKQITWASLFSLQATPAARTIELRAQLAAFASIPLGCFKASPRDDRLYDLLCGSHDQPEIQAATLLSRPILADLVVDIAHWVMILAQITDVYDQNQPDHHKTVDQLLADPSTSGPGRPMIEKSIRVLDVAVASYDQMYGGFTALAVVDALEAPSAPPGAETAEALVARAEAAIALLNNNPYLAENVATILLENHRRGGVSAPPPSEETYREAVKFIETSKAQPEFLMAQIFEGLTFVLDAKGAPALHLAAGKAAMDVPLPAPNQFVSGRLVFPTRFFDLLSTRDELVDRLFDYDVLSNVPSAVRGDIAVSLVGGRP